MKRLIITESQLKTIKKHVLETIDPKEAYQNPSSLQTIIDGKRCVGYIAVLHDRLEDYTDAAKKAGLKVIFVDQPTRNKKAAIIYREECFEDAQKLLKIATDNQGFLPIKDPQETYEIGILLGYHQKNVKEFVIDKFPDYKFY